MRCYIPCKCVNEIGRRQVQTWIIIKSLWWSFFRNRFPSPCPYKSYPFNLTMAFMLQLFHKYIFFFFFFATQNVILSTIIISLCFVIGLCFIVFRVLYNLKWFWFGYEVATYAKKKSPIKQHKFLRILLSETKWYAYK